MGANTVDKKSTFYDVFTISALLLAAVKGLNTNHATVFLMPERLSRHFVLLLDLTKYHQMCPAVMMLEEPVDNPGTTIGRKVSVLHIHTLFCHCGLVVFFPTGPLT